MLIRLTEQLSMFYHITSKFKSIRNLSLVISRFAFIHNDQYYVCSAHIKMRVSDRTRYRSFIVPPRTPFYLLVIFHQLIIKGYVLIHLTSRCPRRKRIRILSFKQWAYFLCCEGTYFGCDGAPPRSHALT